MLSAGKLRHRIDIEQRGATQDAVGQPVESWTLVAAVWADIRHQSGAEAIKASIRIRQRSGLNAGMRVKHGSVIYNILAVPPVVAGREYLDLIGEVVS